MVRCCGASFRKESPIGCKRFLGKEMFGYTSLVPVFSLRPKISKKRGVFCCCCVLGFIYHLRKEPHAGQKFCGSRMCLFLVLNSMSSTGIVWGSEFWDQQKQPMELKLVYPIGSMGLEYLPTFASSPMEPLGMAPIFLWCWILLVQKKFSTSWDPWVRESHLTSLTSAVKLRDQLT